MIAWLQKLRIRDQFLIIILSTTAVIFSIVIVLSVEIAAMVSQKANAYIRDIIAQTKSGVSQDVDNIGRLVLSVAYSPTVQEYLTANGALERYALFQGVERLLTSLKEMRSGLQELILLGDNGNNAGYLGGLDIRAEPFALLAGASTPVCSGLFEVSTSNGSANFLVIGMSVYSLDESSFAKRRIGIVAALVDPKSIGAGVAELSTAHSARFYLLDRKNAVFASNVAADSEDFTRIVSQYGGRAAGAYAVRTGGTSLAVDVIDLEGIGGKMVSIVDEKELLADVSRIRLWALAIFLLALAVLAAPFLLVTNNVVQPLRVLTAFMRGVRSGNPTSLQGRVHLDGYWEIGGVAEGFNGMLDEIDTLTRRLITANSLLYESELLKKKSELSFLRSQINPHFLYNTLESIRSISNLKGVTEVRDMALSLAQMLRYSIRGLETVSLDEELAIVASYLQIQQIRFKNRFEVTYALAEGTREARVLKMILQPLVENAIYHGLEPKRGGGKLHIAANVPAGPTLEIHVKDDGVGMAAESLAALRAELERGEARDGDEGRGVGLANVHQRLRLTFGPEAGVQVQSSRGAGTEVRVRMPYQRCADV